MTRTSPSAGPTPGYEPPPDDDGDVPAPAPDCRCRTGFLRPFLFVGVWGALSMGVLDGFGGRFSPMDFPTPFHELAFVLSWVLMIGFLGPTWFAESIRWGESPAGQMFSLPLLALGQIALLHEMFRWRMKRARTWDALRRNGGLSIGLVRAIFTGVAVSGLLYWMFIRR